MKLFEEIELQNYLKFIEKQCRERQTIGYQWGSERDGCNWFRLHSNHLREQKTKQGRLVYHASMSDYERLMKSDRYFVSTSLDFVIDFLKFKNRAMFEQKREMTMYIHSFVINKELDFCNVDSKKDLQKLKDNLSPVKFNKMMSYIQHDPRWWAIMEDHEIVGAAKLAGFDGISEAGNIKSNNPDKGLQAHTLEMYDLFQKEYGKDFEYGNIFLLFNGYKDLTPIKQTKMIWTKGEDDKWNCIYTGVVKERK